MYDGIRTRRYQSLDLHFALFLFRLFSNCSHTYRLTNRTRRYRDFFVALKNYRLGVVTHTRARIFIDKVPQLTPPPSSVIAIPPSPTRVHSGEFCPTVHARNVHSIVTVHATTAYLRYLATRLRRTRNARRTVAEGKQWKGRCHFRTTQRRARVSPSESRRGRERNVFDNISRRNVRTKL